MKILFCWRCQMNIPMLDEQEFARVMQFSMCDRTRRLQEYKAITGFDESNHSAIWHHRIEQYGLPCVNCGKPLRTPQAAFCAACGKTVE